ncbi:Methylmalonyl-CoA mutase [Flagellimonas maritima]|uniref:Methylmalonyl-CoA mutase n=1 Tax=Flagellimonas maritima TaxID=1383885 RepID=A0A2Z4LNJ7_9FLAO|nr:methylmalonyl-CoA mutase subunit beta [Allomuricauda aurantiaca]AWX43309.1 Methylmalonyl-CoA mutase [Allomuricauda aurantiaca]
MSKPNLFDEFQSVSAKQWKQKIQFDLKGADYNETLLWESLEGINVKPFYHAEDLKGLKVFQFPKDHDWNIAQSIYVEDSKTANTKALDCLKKGVDSILFVIPNKDIDFEGLLSKINLEQTPVHFSFQFLDVAPIKEILKLVQGIKAKLSFTIDIIGNLAKTGNWYHKLEKDHALLEEIYTLSCDKNKFSIIGVDILHYQNAGANMVQQLAYGLAHANEYLNYLTDGLSGKKSFPITFKVSVSGNYFFEIAKLRALRWLWKSLATAYGLENDCQIIAKPSIRNKTLYDYNVNMLRTTSECMSAILGGADTIINLPYDAVYHKTNEFAERIARNQLLLLKEESYFDNASKMAEGAYYIESLTQQLAQKALELFKQIESSGGFLKELKKGNIQRKIKESAEKEQQLFNSTALTLVGTNKYQNLEDRMKGDLERHPFVKTKPRKTIIEPIIAKRLAEMLEQKRLDDE